MENVMKKILLLLPIIATVPMYSRQPGASNTNNTISSVASISARLAARAQLPPSQRRYTNQLDGRIQVPPSRSQNNQPNQILLLDR